MISFEDFGFYFSADENGVRAEYMEQDISGVRDLAYLLACLDQVTRQKKFEPSPIGDDGQVWIRGAQKDKIINFGICGDGNTWSWLDPGKAAVLRLAVQKFFNLVKP